MRQLEVQIMGQSYLLTCPEDGEVRLREAVAKVDEAMCSIRDLGKVKARDRIAVLAALNLTFELMQALAAKAAAAPVQAPAPAAEAPQASQPSQASKLPKAPQAPQKPQPSQAPTPHMSGQPQVKPDEAGSKAPHPQLQTLLQRLNTALGASNSRPD